MLAYLRCLHPGALAVEAAAGVWSQHHAFDPHSVTGIGTAVVLAMRSRLRIRPALQDAPMNWSTGVILAMQRLNPGVKNFSTAA